MPTLDLLLAASFLHAGFQLTVTLVVYPGLADVPPERWEHAHARHTSRIAPLVGLVYGPLAIACAVVLLGLLGVIDLPPSGTSSVAGALVAVAGAAGAALTTALGPARLHDVLGGRHDAAVLRRLLVQDRWRSALAVIGAFGALLAVLG